MHAVQQANVLRIRRLHSDVQLTNVFEDDSEAKDHTKESNGLRHLCHNSSKSQWNLEDDGQDKEALDNVTHQHTDNLSSFVRVECCEEEEVHCCLI